jgi:hypothetical protein
MNTRPFRTEYFTDANHSSCSSGHSCSEQGAVRGAVVRVFMRQYSLARVFHEGIPLFSIRRSRSGVQVRYGRS